MNESFLLKNDLAILKALTATMSCVVKVVDQETSHEELLEMVKNAFTRIDEASTQVDSSVNEYIK